MKRLALAGLVPICALSMVSVRQVVHAQDVDIARIPKASGDIAGEVADGQPASPASNDASFISRVNLDTAITAVQGRQNPTLPRSGTDEWIGRADLNMVDMWTLSPDLTATLSNRINVLGRKYDHSASRHDATFDFREGYLAWSSAATFYVDVGRINVRNGAAIGWNPTDFFKAGSSLAQTSADPSSVRNDRLGTAMMRIQYLWSGGSVGIALAPKLQTQALLDGSMHSGFDAHFDRTNAQDRYLLTASFDVADLSPQLLAYGETGMSRIGLNISRPIGDNIVAYAEWSGGNQKGLAARAVEFGQQTGVLPDALPLLPGSDANAHFQQDAVLGASVVLAGKLTLNLEYHYHESGLSGSALRNAFAAASAAPATLGSEWWYVRDFAADRQEPTARRQIFIRAAANDAFVRDLDISTFAFEDIHDQSVFTQLSASYHISDLYTVSLLLSKTFGGLKTEYGALPTMSSETVQIVRYF